MENTKYYKHHTSLAVGYVRVGKTRMKKYNGRFGKGYKVFKHNDNSTRFCLVTYYVEK